MDGLTVFSGGILLVRTLMANRFGVMNNLRMLMLFVYTLANHVRHPVPNCQENHDEQGYIGRENGQEESRQKGIRDQYEQSSSQSAIARENSATKL
nr:hypothetical protein CFP56_22027 [Quercus suber]